MDTLIVYIYAKCALKYPSIHLFSPVLVKAISLYLSIICFACLSYLLIFPISLNITYVDLSLYYSTE